MNSDNYIKKLVLFLILTIIIINITPAMGLVTYNNTKISNSVVEEMKSSSKYLSTTQMNEIENIDPTLYSKADSRKNNTLKIPIYETLDVKMIDHNTFYNEHITETYITNNTYRVKQASFNTGKDGKVEVLFSDDFEYWFWENIDSYWYRGDSNSEDGLDYWGLSDYRSHGGGHSVWCAEIGENSVYGYSNSEVHMYDNNMEAYLSIKNSLNLADKDLVYVEFYAWWDLEQGYDYIDLAITDDPSSGWHKIWSRTGSHRYWEPVRVPIYDYEYYGSTFRIGFNFRSDYSIVKEGVYIDDFKISAADIVIKSWSIDKVEVKPGDNLKIALLIDNPAPVSVPAWIGVSLIDPDGKEIIDPSNDLYVNLTPGESYHTREFHIPENVVHGKYDIIVAVWGKKQNGVMYHQFDSDRRNGVLSIGLPDLIVKDISYDTGFLGPETPATEDPVTLKYWIKNIGEITAHRFKIRLYIDNHYIKDQEISSLSPGEEVEIKINHFVLDNYGLGPGNHIVKVVADPGNVVKENNEYNNARQETYYWRGPNLVVTEIHWEDWWGNKDQYIVAGHEVAIEFKIKNTGDGPTHKQVNVTIFMDYSKYYIVWTFNGLDPGKEITYKTKHRLYTNSIAVDYDKDVEIKVTVDTEKTVRESNENDNTKTVEVSIKLAKWTFALYSSGGGCGNRDKDLSKIVQGHINAFKEAGSSREVNAIILADKMGEATKVYYALNGGSSGTLVEIPLNEISSEPGWKNNEINMGDYHNLVKFASYIFTRFRAQHYVLVIHNHGGGIWGTIWDDESSKQCRNIQIWELGLALKNILYNTYIDKLDLFGIDACLMSMMEVAYELRDSTKYIVASEKTEWAQEYSGSWRYKDVINFLKQNPDTDPLSLGKKIVDTYINYWSSNSVTLAVIDTRYVDELANEVSYIGYKLAHIMYKYNDTIVAFYPFIQKMDSPNHVDLWDLMEKIDQYIPAKYSDIHSHIDMFRTYFDLTVKYFRKHNKPEEFDIKNAHGLSIYFPKPDPSEYKTWKNLRASIYSKLDFYKLYWDEFIDNVYEPRYGIFIEDIMLEPSIAPHNGYTVVTIKIRNNTTYTEDIRIYLSFSGKYTNDYRGILSNVYSVSNETMTIELEEPVSSLKIDVYLVEAEAFMIDIARMVHSSISNSMLILYDVELEDAWVSGYIDHDHDNKYSRITVNWETALSIRKEASVESILVDAFLYARSSDGEEVFIDKVRYNIITHDTYNNVISLPGGIWDIKIVLKSEDEPDIVLAIIDYGEDQDLNSIPFDDDDRYITVLSVRDTSVEYSDKTYITAKLAREDETPLSGELIRFYVYRNNEWEWIGTISTDKQGYAELPFEAYLVPGVYQIKVEYEGSTDYKPSRAYGKITIYKEETHIDIEITGEPHYGDTCNIQIHVLDNDYSPVKNVYVEIYLVKDETKTYLGGGYTNSDGKYTLQYVVNVEPGTYSFEALFRGNKYYTSSDARETYTFYREYIRVNVIDLTYVYGDPITLKAYVTDDESNPIDNLVAKFYIKINDREEYVGEATVKNGYAELIYDTVLDPGKYTVHVIVEGNKYYYDDENYGSLVIKCKPPLIISPRNGDYVRGKINISIKTIHSFKLMVYLQNSSSTILIDARSNVSGETMIPLDTTQYVDGRYKIVVKYTYQTNNYVEENSTAIWISIDNTPPSGRIIAPMNMSYVSGIVKIRFNYEDASPVEAYLIICKESYNITGSYEYDLNTMKYSDGELLIKLLVIDRAGNNNTYILVLIIDNTIPIVNITYPHHGQVVTGLVDINISFYDDNLYISRLLINGTIVIENDTVYRWNTTKYVDGYYNITALAIDRAGNIAWETIFVEVDNTPPYAEILHPGNHSLIGETLSIETKYYDKHLDSAYIVIDNIYYINITGEYSVRIDTGFLEEGPHMVMLIVNDTVGHVTNYTIYIDIDHTPPTAYIYQPKNNTLVHDIIVIRFSYNDRYLNKAVLYIDEYMVNVTGIYEYRFDTKRLDDDFHIIKLVVDDLAGHVTSYEIMVDVDNTAPEIRIIAPKNNTFVSSTCTIRFEAIDPHLTNTYIYIDDSLVAVNTTSYSWDTTLYEDKIYTIKIEAVDILKHSSYALIYVNVDNNPPYVVIKYPSNNSFVRGIVNIVFNYSDPFLDKVLLYIDQKLYENITDKYSTLLDTRQYVDGVHSIILQAYDKAGNTNTYMIYIIIDNTKPEIHILSPQNKTFYRIGSIIRVKWEINESHLEEVLLYINNTVINVTGYLEYFIDTDELETDTYRIGIKVFDSAGNVGEEYVYIYISSTILPPTTTSRESITVITPLPTKPPSYIPIPQPTNIIFGSEEQTTTHPPIHDVDDLKYSASSSTSISISVLITTILSLAGIILYRTKVF